MPDDYCPRCHGSLGAHPATTRRDPVNDVPICPECGMEEAMVDFARATGQEISYEVARRELDFVAFLRWRQGMPTN